MQKSILITGCSTGIGLRSAIVLQKRGYQVFATVRRERDVKSLENQGLQSFILNVDDSESIQHCLSRIQDLTQGKLYALFNNAGFGVTGSIEHLSRDALRSQFETNVFGPIELISQVLPLMRKQGFGRIIQNTSILGIVPIPYYGAYTASKFALEALSRTLRQELHGTDIFVSTIAPGPIATQFRSNALEAHHKEIHAHHPEYDQLRKYLTAKKVQWMSSPDAVVKKLISALESKHPKAHYYVGIPAHLLAFLRRLLCDPPLDWILNKLSRA